MLRIHDDMLDVIRSMRGALGAIDKRDADLARQLRRAASSVVLNLAEGSGSFGRVRTVRYRTALGSARETLACLQTAEAFGYARRVPEIPVQIPLPNVPCEVELTPAPRSPCRATHGRNVRHAEAHPGNGEIAVVDCVLARRARIRLAPRVLALLATPGRGICPFSIARKERASAVECIAR